VHRQLVSCGPQRGGDHVVVVGVGVGLHDGGDEPGCCGVCGHGGVPHGLDATEDLFDLARLDPEAPDLDLAVDASEVLQLTVEADAHPVTGAVAVMAGSSRFRDEALGAPDRVADVAQRHAGPTDPQLAHQAGGHPTAGGVHHVEPGLPERAADRHVGLVRRHGGHLEPGGEGRGLRRAVDVQHPSGAARRQQEADGLGVAALTAEQQRVEAPERRRVGASHELHEGGGEEQHVHAPAVQRRSQLARRQELGCVEDVDTAPVREGAPHLERGGVEGWVRGMPDCGTRLDLHEVAAGHQVVHRAVGHRHRLRCARRAGGEQHVRRVLGVVARAGASADGACPAGSAPMRCTTRSSPTSATAPASESSCAARSGGSVGSIGR
jgi:hypothetical protein